MNIIFDTITENDDFDLFLFASDFMASKMSNMTEFPLDYWTERTDQCSAWILNNDYSHFDSINDIITEYQYYDIEYIFQAIESAKSVQEIIDNLYIIEKTFHSDNYQDDYWKCICLGTISIAKYSYMFAINNLFEEKEGQGFLNRVKKVVKADAAGFVGGAIGSIVSGHAAAATVFGPEGTVVTIAAEGATGAIVGSGLEVGRQVGSHIINH